MTRRVQRYADDLIRMAPAAPTLDGRTLTGFVVVYNSPAEIRSWEGHFRETMKPGSGRKTVAERGLRTKVLFNHGLDPRIGEWPLGKPSVLEERSGLGNDGEAINGIYAEVPVAETSYGDDILALAEAGAIDGWSFRFSVPKGKDTWHRPATRGQLPERDIHEFVMPEFGPVTFQAYESTTLGVRSAKDFTVWQQLPETKRGELARIFDMGEHLGTSAESTRSDGNEDDEEEAASETSEEPDGSTDEADEDDTTPDAADADAAEDPAENADADAQEPGDSAADASAHHSADEDEDTTGPSLDERAKYVRQMKAASLLEGATS